MTDIVPDNEERRNLMDFVVESYYDFVVSLSEFKILWYDVNIDNGTLSRKFKALSSAFVKLYYMTNAQLPNTNIIDRFDECANVDIPRFNTTQSHTFINRIVCLMSEYQKYLGENNLLPLLNERIGMEI